MGRRKKHPYKSKPTQQKNNGFHRIRQRRRMEELLERTTTTHAQLPRTPPPPHRYGKHTQPSMLTSTMPHAHSLTHTERLQLKSANQFCKFFLKHCNAYVLIKYIK